MALAAVRITSSTFTLARRSLCGSISTCNCRSRSPQTDTLDTPGTASKRWRTFQRASVEISTSETSLDDIEKIISRLVLADGWIT